MTQRFPHAARLSAVAAVAAALTAFAGVAAAQQPAFPKNAPGYVVSSDGQPVLSGSGSCVQTGAWSLGTSVDPCDQIARVSVPVPVVMYEQKPAGAMRTAAQVWSSRPSTPTPSRRAW